jgi:leucine-zipper of insertion element IS481
VVGVASMVGVSRQTVHSWLARYEADGLVGLARSCDWDGVPRSPRSADPGSGTTPDGADNHRLGGDRLNREVRRRAWRSGFLLIT